MLRFNSTDDNENRCAGWHWHFTCLDFLIWGFWACWQWGTQALFSHFRVVVAIFCYKMHFHIFWSLGKIFWWESWQCQLCRRMTWVQVPCSWCCVLMQPMTMKIGVLVGISISHVLTFSDFWSEASEPVGSEQREHCSVISGWLWLFSAITCIFTYFGGLVKFFEGNHGSAA